MQVECRTKCICQNMMVFACGYDKWYAPLINVGPGWLQYYEWCLCMYSGFVCTKRLMYFRLIIWLYQQLPLNVYGGARKNKYLDPFLRWLLWYLMHTNKIILYIFTKLCDVVLVCVGDWNHQQVKIYLRLIRSL